MKTAQAVQNPKDMKTVQNLKSAPLSARRAAAVVTAAVGVAVALGGPAFAAQGASAVPTPAVSTAPSAAPSPTSSAKPSPVPSMPGSAKPSPVPTMPGSAKPSPVPSMPGSAKPSAVPSPTGSATPGSAPQPSTAPAGNELAHTGSSATTTALAAGAAGLVAVGAGALYTVRRRAAN
ncbi:LAETG motif-containing sortase-dependent surface protein [Streptomyces sp. NPDC003042]